MVACLVLYQDILESNNPADANLIDIAARCLLIEDGNRLILIDTGMEISNQKFLVIILWGSHSMDKSLKHGFIVMMLPMFL
jgi:hypothetical protein